MHVIPVNFNVQSLRICAQGWRACRHIKDRMERAGMRWKIPGVQAMLHLRTVAANDHWEEFQTFKIDHETKRLCPHTTALETVEWPVAA